MNPIIETNDTKTIVRSVARTECNKMHMIANLMKQVRQTQKAPEFSFDAKFCSARSPECLDEILDKLIYMFECEANCGLVELVEAVADKPIEQTVLDHDKIKEMGSM